MTESVEAIVIGAGAAGLSAAFRLQKLGVSVINLESDAYPGGVVRSYVEQGFHLESGPNSLVMNPYLEGLIEELGLGGDLVEAEPVYKLRYLVKDKALHAISPHPLKILATPYLSLRAKARLFSERFRPCRPGGDESVADFFGRRFGREVAESMADPIMTGIFAGDIHRLSAAHTIPRLVDWERGSGSVTKGLMRNRDAFRGGRRVVNFRGGIQQMMDAFAGELGAALITEARITDILSREGGYTVVYEEKGVSNSLETQCIVYAAPPFVLRQFPFFKGVHEAGRGIEYVPVRVVHVGIRKDGLSLPPGFGFLAPSRENLALLGCIFTSSIFPFKSPPGSHLITVMIGGAHRAKELMDDPKALEDQAMQELKEILRMGTDPVVLGGLTRRCAIPQKNLGYGAILEAFRAFERDHKGVYFAGNYLSGVSVPDTMQYGSKVAVRVAEAVGQRR